MGNEDIIKDQARAVRIQALASHHDISGFDCGVDSLNTFLQKHALAGPAHGLSQTWVAIDDDDVVLAFFTLRFATITPTSATARVAKGVGGFDIPCILLARLAVDKDLQGQGLGSVILEDAMRKAVALGRTHPTDVTPALPVRAMLVHAKSSEAFRFYEAHGFEPSPTDPLHQLILLKDIAKSFRMD